MSKTWSNLETCEQTHPLRLSEQIERGFVRRFSMHLRSAASSPEWLVVILFRDKMGSTWLRMICIWYGCSMLCKNRFRQPRCLQKPCQIGVSIAFCPHRKRTQEPWLREWVTNEDCRVQQRLCGCPNYLKAHTQTHTWRSVINTSGLDRDLIHA